MPIRDAQVFRFEKGKCAEVAILLEREGGILITCDAYQNWTKTTYAACSPLGRVVRSIATNPLRYNLTFRRAK